MHQSLDAAGIKHAFGGALALAYCTQEPRATIDIDVNVFVAPEEVEEVFASLPEGVKAGQKDRATVRRDGQVRLWWGETPIDLFFDYHPFHEAAAGRAHMVPFGDERIPVLSCEDLAVFKGLFNRTKDWADLEAMAAAGTLDRSVREQLVALVGEDDERVDRLDRVLAVAAGPAPSLHDALGQPHRPHRPGSPGSPGPPGA
jgi:hypothetical protein